MDFLVGGLGLIVSKQVVCVEICVNCTLYCNEGRGKNNKRTHIQIKVAHCDGIGEELFIRRIVAFMKVLWVVVLGGLC